MFKPTSNPTDRSAEDGGCNLHPATIVKHPKPKKPKVDKRFATLIGVLACISFLLIVHVIEIYFAIGGALLVALPEGQIRSGKSGTVVWLRNGVMRIKKIPSLVRNSYTTAVRATLSGWSSQYRGLSQDEQNSWINAQGFHAINRIGQLIAIKGKMLFIRLNSNLELIASASPFHLTAPAPVELPFPSLSAAPTFPTSGGSPGLTFTLGNDDADFGLLIEATAKLSAGINRPGRSLFRVILADNDSTGVTSPDNTSYQAKFGALNAGDVIFVRFSYVHNVTGQQSIPTEAFKIVCS